MVFCSPPLWGGGKNKIEKINKLKKIFKKKNHPNFGKVSSSEKRKAISEGIKKFYLNNSHSSKGLKGKLSPQYGIGGKLVFCYNKKGEELIFPSINGAKQHFKVRWTFIKKSILKIELLYKMKDELFNLFLVKINNISP